MGINSLHLFQTLQRRNLIFHSPSMELEDNYLKECIDDIIAILEDEKELRETQNSKQAVEKLEAVIIFYLICFSVF